VLIDVDPAVAPGGLHVARLRLLFSLAWGSDIFPCALIRWFPDIAEEPDADTGLRIVQPEDDDAGEPVYEVVHLDSIVRAAHLLPVFGPEMVPADLHYSQTLDVFRAFYLNCFIDHHAYDLLH
jgi:hypothetical protein